MEMQTVVETLAPETVDPVMDRAMFFMDLELAELTAVIPRAEAVEPKQVY